MGKIKGKIQGFSVGGIMSFVVVFSKETGRIRSIFVPDNDEQIKDLLYLDGEDSIIFDDKEVPPLEDLQKLVSDKTGLIPKDDRYAVVDDKGEVKAIIIADPKCGDSIKDHELIASIDAEMQDVYDKSAQVFIKSVKETTTTPRPEPSPSPAIIDVTDVTDIKKIG
jgi:hypothetical protein